MLSVTKDEELKACVWAELARDPSLAGAEVAVIAKDGVVTSAGHVDTVAQKEAGERAVRFSGGMCGIAFELDAKSDLGHKPSDSEIAHAALTALRAHARITPDSVGVEVERGWLTLSGDLGSQLEILLARRCVGGLAGLRDVCCCIQVAPAAGPLPHVRVGAIDSPPPCPAATAALPPVPLPNSRYSAWWRPSGRVHTPPSCHLTGRGRRCCSNRLGQR